MAANGPKKTTSSLPVIAILVILAGAFYVSRSPLESSRPEAPADLRHAVREEDKIEARLWQDPLKVALDHEKSMHVEAKVKDSNTEPKCSSIHNVNHVFEQIGGLSTDKGEDNAIVRVLLLMIRGGVTAEDHERRLRNRYAVLTALHSSGLVPDDTKHIQYFRLPWTEKKKLEESIRVSNVPKIGKCDNESSSPLVVPFEWFRRCELSPITKIKWYDEMRPENVLVVWLAESAFSGRPLTRLAQVINALGLAHNSGVRIDVIGPSHSGTLREMLSEVKPIHSSKGQADDPNYVNVHKMLNGLTIYSPWSTASPVLLRPEESWTVSDSSENSISEMYRVIPDKFASIGVEFYRMIGTDDLLVLHLIRELHRRGVDVVGGTDRVALISEWDTFYGKAFPLTFATMMESIDPNFPYNEPNWFEYAGKLKRKDDFSEKYFKKNLFIFSYFQGIDGRLPESESSEDQKQSEKTEITSQLTLTKSPELPISRSQLDYIRRLAQKLTDEHQVKAFGVVGTDVYDKLLLIQALREQLGCVIIFTLDLDSRMLHSGQFKWTRNVIVASNFGLELSKKYQRGVYEYAQKSIPPFRDNYQTSLYFTCRRALGLSLHTGESISDISWEKMIEAITHPRLFEIGRECAVNLSVKDADIHPPRRIPPDNLRNLILLISSAIVLCVLLLVQFSSRVRKVVVGLHPLRWDIVGVTAKIFGPVLIVAVIWFVAVVIDEHYYEPTGEPFSLVKGVSIWPGEALRLLCVILSLCFILKSMYDLKANEKELCKWFNSEKPEEFRRTAISCKRKSIRLYSEEDGEKHVQGQQLWKSYLHKGALLRRIGRVLLMSITYVLIAGSLMLILGPPKTPYRGVESRKVDIFLLRFSVSFMMFLIFFVLDAIQRSRKFIRKLKGYVTSWPKEVFEYLKVNESDGLAEWLDIKFIAFHTEAVGKLIYYPFIVLLIMFLARNRYFDNWDFPILLIIIFLVNFTYALVSAILLRRVAEQSRRVAIDRLQIKLVNSAGAGDKNHTKQLETMIEEINSLHKGAFSSFLENPVVHVLLGSGGAGLIALMRYMQLS